MLNLNRHRARAEYAGTIDGDPDVSGAAAYARYGRNTLPHVLRRHGAPVFVAEPIGLVAGAASHLAAPWDELLLVRYPRRDQTTAPAQPSAR